VRRLGVRLDGLTRLEAGERAAPPGQHGARRRKQPSEYGLRLLEKQKLPVTLAGLGRSAGFLRSQLAKRIKMYTTPELRFAYDESVERGDQLSRLIDKALQKR